jgi:hypothetical protein
MTAEDDKLYTTFDEILSKVRPDPGDKSVDIDNNLPDLIGVQHMELLLDCLILPEGPRLRDKISHGELNLDEDITSQNIFRMCIYIIMSSYNDLEQYLCMSENKILTFNDYTALFHPKRLLIDELDEIVIAVQNISDHPSLSETSDLGPEDPLTNLGRNSIFRKIILFEFEKITI